MTTPSDFDSEDSQTNTGPELKAVSSEESPQTEGYSGDDLPRAGIVTARGTGDGLVIRLDSRAQPAELEGALTEFLTSRKGFLQGNGVYLEWVGHRPSEHLSAKIVKIITDEFLIRVLESRPKSEQPLRERETDKPRGIAPLSRTEDPLKTSLQSDQEEVEMSLFDGMKDSPQDLVSDQSGFKSSDIASSTGSRTDMWDEPDARVVYGTLRSGQKIETEHTVIICGDINSGADVVAGGDIIVLGKLRGVAHAGAYDETGGGRFIFALDFRPTQLRIGTVISRGAEVKTTEPEIAKIEGNMIVVEPYRSRVSPRAISS